MDGNRKKELKEQYRLMKPEMGILIIRSNENKECYIEATQNLRAVINSTRAKILNNMHPNFEFQRILNAKGSENYKIEVLENLPYDKDESKTDYGEDWILLEMIWEEKLKMENLEVYKKKRINKWE